MVSLVQHVNMTLGVIIRNRVLQVRCMLMCYELLVVRHFLDIEELRWSFVCGVSNMSIAKSVARVAQLAINLTLGHLLAIQLV